MAKVRACHEYFVDRAQGYEFCGRPVVIAPPNVALYTGGPLTIALGICGPALLEAMLLDEAYYHRVMDLVTSAIIERMRAWRAYLNLEPVPQTMPFADDSIQLLSVRSYRENVLPYHRRILSALAQHGAQYMHLCGNVQRHLPTLVTELGVRCFDTGYPINFATLREEVGEGVEIWGGVPVASLLADTSDRIYARSASILKSGIMRGGKFVLKEANNLPPMTPPDNLAAMYRAAREVGVYVA
jgi:uroporphyrinogen decarboxylase